MNCFKGTIEKYPVKIKINSRKDVFIKKLHIIQTLYHENKE